MTDRYGLWPAQRPPAEAAIHIDRRSTNHRNGKLFQAANGTSPRPATLDLLARHDDLRGLCVVGGGGDGVINALSQLPKQPSLCCILQESTELSRQALDQGLISLVIDSQPRLLAAALVDLLVELQTTPDFDPIRHRIHVPLQIITSENARH